MQPKKSVSDFSFFGPKQQPLTVNTIVGAEAATYRHRRRMRGEQEITQFPIAKKDACKMLALIADLVQLLVAK